MSNTGDFEDKAARLFNRLNAATQPARIYKNKPEYAHKTVSKQELQKIRDEIEASDLEARRKMRALTESLKKLETSLTEEN